MVNYFFIDADYLTFLATSDAYFSESSIEFQTPSLDALLALNGTLIITSTVKNEAAGDTSFLKDQVVDYWLDLHEPTGKVFVPLTAEAPGENGGSYDSKLIGGGEASIQNYIDTYIGTDNNVKIFSNNLKDYSIEGVDVLRPFDSLDDLLFNGSISLLQYETLASAFLIGGAIPSGDGNVPLYLLKGVQTDLIDHTTGESYATVEIDPATGDLIYTYANGEVFVIDKESKFILDSNKRPEIIDDFCFPAGTAIAIGNGKNIPIEKINVGDFVECFDPHEENGKGKTTLKKVVRLFENETDEWLRLIWHEGSVQKSLTTTPGHRFLDERGNFRRIDEIACDVSPKVVLANGSIAQIAISQIFFTKETADQFELAYRSKLAAGSDIVSSNDLAWRSYNFEVEDFHTYIAEGVRVHNDSQQTIDFSGQLGRSFGTQLGQILLEDESQFIQILGGTVLGTVTENLAEIITDTGYHLFDGSQLNLADAAEDALRQLENVGEEFASGIRGAATSLFLAELGEELGLEGFGADLFNVVGSAYLGTVVDQVAGNLAAGNLAFDGVDWSEPLANLPGAIGAFFGSSLAKEILPAETLEGAIGGSLGSIAGVSLGASLLGSTSLATTLGNLGNFILPGIGAFLGTLLGTFLGDLFGDEPDPGADFWMFAEQQGEAASIGVYNWYLHAVARDGFDADGTSALGQAILDLSKNYMHNIGAYEMANANIDNFTPHPAFTLSTPLIRVLQQMNIEVSSNGDLSYFVNGLEVDSPEAMVDAAVTDFLRDMQPIGGDFLVKRAIANSEGEDSFTLASAMAMANEYEGYLENREVINALLAGSADTAFAGSWVYILAGAEELKLSELHEVDFNGGLSGFLASLTDTGISVDYSDIGITGLSGNKVQFDIRVDNAGSIPSYYHLFANSAELATDSDGSILRLVFENNMDGVGYTNISSYSQVSGTNRYNLNGESAGRDLWIATDNKHYNFTDIGTHLIQVGDDEIESSDDILISGAGNDRLYAGTGWDWVEGGGGADTIEGGDQNDTLFGGIGNDTLYGGRQHDFLEGGAGADKFFGLAPGEDLPATTHGTDYDTVSYKSSDAGVSVNLGTGSASGGHATGDTFSHIVNLVGSGFDDTLIGDALPNRLEGGAGADVLNGGGNSIPNSYDFASYFHASSGITASLGDTTKNTGDAAGDTYINITGIYGSNFNDILSGDSGDNYLAGFAGDDILIAGAGQDVIRGGFGFDIMSYREQSEGITLNLEDWSASSSVVADDVRYNYTSPNSMDIEAYEGSNFADELIGADTNDILIGRDGDDTILGRNGSDILLGDEGNDHLKGESGDDSLYGGAGTDNLVGGAGNDYLNPGATGGQWQYVAGQAGDDTYLVTASSGLTFLNGYAEIEGGGFDRIVFEESSIGEVSFSYTDFGDSNPNGNSLNINWNKDGVAGTFRIANEGDHIERFVFADGSTISRIEVNQYRKLYPDKANFANDERDFLYGTGEDDIIRGGSDSNNIYGGGGNDTIYAGGSSGEMQYLMGHNGDDSYHYQKASGLAWITSGSENEGSGNDTFYFDDLRISDLHFEDTTHGSHTDILRISWSLGGESGYVNFSEHGDHIERFVFADGSSISRIEVNQYRKLYPDKANFANDERDFLYGTGEDDIIRGGSDSNNIYGGGGNDTIYAGGSSGEMQYLMGHSGDDSYHYQKASGLAWITSGSENEGSGNDTFYFDDLNITDLKFEKTTHGSHNDILRVSWSKDGESGYVNFSAFGDHIERFVFADGSSISRVDADYRDHLDPNDPRDWFVGTNGNDVIQGSSETSVISGAGGDDHLISGKFTGFANHMIGGEGNDTYSLYKDSGHTWLTTNSENAATGNSDNFIFEDLALSEITLSSYDHSTQGEVLRISWNSDGYTGRVDIAEQGNYIEQFEFSDGTLIDSASLWAMV